MEIIYTHHSVSTAISLLSNHLTTNHINIFAIFNHSEAASQVDMVLPETQVIVFGDPKVGTFLMQENNAIALALPLKIAVWEHETQTALGYTKPSSLADEFTITEHKVILEKMDHFMSNLISVVLHAE
jgi:uncharacterized protein (DUF302 family)